MITGALNTSVTIDNRLFTSEGKSSIESDFKNLGNNTKQSIIGAVKILIELLKQHTRFQKKLVRLLEEKLEMNFWVE